MNLKEEIMKNLGKLNVEEYDQSVHGKGNYDRLSTVIIALLEAGFTVSEVEDIVFNKLPINCKDKTLVKRWDKAMKGKAPSRNSLWVLMKTFGIKIDESLLPKKPMDVFNSLYHIGLKAQHRKNVSTLKQYLANNKDDIEIEFDKNYNSSSTNDKNVNNLKDFFYIMFPDEDFDEGIYLLATNMNNTKTAYFNNSIFDTSGPNYMIKEFTHFCLNRPYIRMKAPYEGVCETDILNARYVLIEVDEGLTLNEQVLLGKLMVIKKLPVKMITKSGGKSVHIVLDLKIGLIEALKQKGLTTGKLDLSNYCNTSPKQYINGFTQAKLQQRFKYNNMNDFYKDEIVKIYDSLYSVGIHPDYSCKNLNRWTRIANGFRNDGKYKEVQECIYLRPVKFEEMHKELCDISFNKIENTLEDVRKFTSDLLADYDAAYDRLNEI